MSLIPERYRTARLGLGLDSISMGASGIELFRVDEIEAGQAGYSIDPDGRSLCDGQPGSWQPNWLAIGYETACGDPIIMDVGDPALPVFSDIHGQGKWEPSKIAVSMEAFIAAFREIGRISVGRESPVELKANPVSDDEHEAVLAKILELNAGEISAVGYWELFFLTFDD